ncbi:zinc knuckle-domain-containing protein, partial [Catenaria anguillulae PL171]
MPLLKDVRPSSRSSASTAVQCQKCLQHGHWTYECKKEAPAYQHRPSRTQQLGKGTDRAPRVKIDPLEIPGLSAKQRAGLVKGTADRLLQEKEKERERERRTRRRSSSSSSASGSESSSSSDTTSSGSDSDSDSDSSSSSSCSSSSSSSDSSRGRSSEGTVPRRHRRHRRYSSSASSSGSS